jgi:hypothetical protein
MHGDARYRPGVLKPEIQRLDSHAASTLRYIRASMEGAVSLAVPGSAGLALGVLGLITAAISSTPSLHPYWLGIWLSASLIGAVVGGTLVVRESSLRSLRLIGTPLRKFALCLTPSLFGAVIMTAIHWTSGNLHAIPGTWLLLYGCALIAASAATTRTIAVLGGCFALLGMAALLLPDALQILMLAIGFGGLHIVFGFVIGRSSHAPKV